MRHYRPKKRLGRQAKKQREKQRLIIVIVLLAVVAVVGILTMTIRGRMTGATADALDASADTETPQVAEPYPSDVTITITFGDQKEELTGDVIDTWMSSRSPSYVVDTTKVNDYVKKLAEKYDTMYTYHKFKTSFDKTITIKGGTYGWKMDVSSTTTKVLEAIHQVASATVEPEFTQKAASFGDNDYGDTYVEVNLTAQKVFLYKDGECVLTSDVVTGDQQKESTHTTEGIWRIEYKQLNAKLSGAEYQTPVAFWMPFNGGIGLHDALWRDKFGNDIYETDGSHGCVNLPYFVAKKIYQSIEEGDPVIVYTLDGTESNDTTTQSDSKIASAVDDAIERVGSVEDLNKKTYNRLYYAEWFYQRLNSSRKSLVTKKSQLNKLKEEYKNQTGKSLTISELN